MLCACPAGLLQALPQSLAGPVAPHLECIAGDPEFPGDGFRIGGAEFETLDHGGILRFECRDEQAETLA